MLERIDKFKQRLALVWFFSEGGFGKDDLWGEMVLEVVFMVVHMYSFWLYTCTHGCTHVQFQVVHMYTCTHGCTHVQFQVVSLKSNVEKHVELCEHRVVLFIAFQKLKTNSLFFS